MAKTYNSIKTDFLQRHVSNMDSGMHKKDAVAQSLLETEAELLIYYRSSEGKREIEDSAFKGLTPEAAVETLMQDVRSWAKTIREAK